MKRLQGTGGRKPQEISTKSKLETATSTGPYVAHWAFSIFADRQPPRGRQQNQGCIQTQTLKSGSLNKGTHENNPTSPPVVYFLPASPYNQAWGTQYMKDEATKGKSATQGLAFPCLSFGESPSFQAYMYIKQAGTNSGVVWGARLCVVFAAGGEISLRLIWEQSAEAEEQRGEHQSSEQKYRLIEHLATGGCVQCRGWSHIPQMRGVGENAKERQEEKMNSSPWMDGDWLIFKRYRSHVIRWVTFSRLSWHGQIDTTDEYTAAGWEKTTSGHNKPMLKFLLFHLWNTKTHQSLFFTMPVNGDFHALKILLNFRSSEAGLSRFIRFFTEQKNSQ